MRRPLKYAVRRALERALRVCHRMGYRWARKRDLAVMPALLEWDSDGRRVRDIGIAVWLDGVGTVWTNRPDGDQPMWGPCKCSACVARRAGKSVT